MNPALDAAARALAIAGEDRLRQALALGAALAQEAAAPAAEDATPRSDVAEAQRQIDALREQLHAEQLARRAAEESRDAWEAQHDRVLAELTALRATPLPAAAALPPASHLAIPLAEPDPTPVWTEARIAALRDGWTSTPAAQMMDTLAALPGPVPNSWDAVKAQARRLGLPPRSRDATQTAETQARRVELARQARAAQAAARRAEGDAVSRTAEREAMLAEAWLRTDRSLADILAAWNALPGKPLGTETSLYGIARRLGLPIPRPRAEATQVWTAQRDALITELWPLGTPEAEVIERVNELPGPPVQTAGYLRRRLAHLGVRRDFQPDPAPAEPAAEDTPPAEASAEPEAPAPTARGPLPAPEPQPEPAAPPPPPPAAPTPAPPTEDEARQRAAGKARAMLRDGFAEPLIRQHTGLSPQALADLAAEEAAQADAAADKRLTRARDLLRRGRAPEDVVAATRLPLREVLRLRGELRAERTAA